MGKKMLDKMNVQVEDIMHYLISLFYMTGCKYTCTETKLHKLASIVAFAFVLEDKQLFENPIYKYKGCGTLIDIKDSLIGRDVYIQYQYNDDKKYIEDDFDRSIKVPQIKLSLYHNKIKDIPFEVKMISEEVFRCFGAYSTKDLGILLNPLVDKLIIDDSGLIGLNQLPSAICSEKENNEVERYLISSRMYKDLTKKERLSNIKTLIKV